MSLWSGLLLLPCTSDRAALTAVVASYLPKSALRDVGKALGIDEETLKIVSKAGCGYELELTDEILV